MTTTAFDTAREYLAATWEDTLGTPYVSPDGYADADDFLVVWGASEYLVDGDSNYALLSGTVLFVSRDTGEIREESFVTNMDKIDAMLPIVLP